MPIEVGKTLIEVQRIDYEDTTNVVGTKENVLLESITQVVLVHYAIGWLLQDFNMLQDLLEAVLEPSN